MTNVQPSNMQNVFGGLIGGAQAGYHQSPFQSAQPPTWEQVFHFQRIIMDLQQEVIRLQRDLDKIKNTKEWLVGPEKDGADPAK